MVKIERNHHPRRVGDRRGICTTSAWRLATSCQLIQAAKFAGEGSCGRALGVTRPDGWSAAPFTRGDPAALIWAPSSTRPPRPCVPRSAGVADDGRAEDLLRDPARRSPAM